MFEYLNSKFNFSSRALASMSSYLSNRRQCVKVGDTHNMCNMSTQWVFRKGPPLFSLYINVIPQQCHDAELQMYADDIVVYTHAKTAVSCCKANDCIGKDHTLT